MPAQIRKKRILYYYMWGGSAGGSDTCLFLLLKHLDRAKYEPFILYKDKSILTESLRNKGFNLIPWPGQRDVIIKSASKTITKENLQAKKNPTALRSLLSIIKSLIKQLPEMLKLAGIIIKNKIEIVHTNHFLTGDRPMLLISILLRKKIVSHNRGLYAPDFVDRYISKYIDQIVCMSDFSMSVYVNAGVRESKCKTIYDGIDVGEFKSSNMENESVVVGCIGRLEKWKGQQVLIEAAETIVAKVPEVKFLLVGDGNNENALKLQVKNKGLEKYFEFTGHVTNVNDYMDRSTLIVHTSIEPEPFGMVIIEAMALKKPVVATNFGGPLEIIDDGVDGFLIPAQNPSILAEYLLKLIENPSLRKQIGETAREKVITKFDISAYSKKIELVYEEISN